MGKRSNFERIERDFYPTPLKGVEPLIPHIQEVTSFCEPCAGDGALIMHIQSFGKTCVAAYDVEIRTHGVVQKSFETLTEDDLNGATHIITNPPWDRKLLHPMIEKFSTLRPTWLLFDADWMHTVQSARYMHCLKKIVSVGRVKWIPNSKMTGKDNCCWYLFDSTTEKLNYTNFVGRSAENDLTRFIG